MNITITKDALSTALRRVQGACAGRSAIPALSGVLLRAKDGQLEAVASNGDMQISHKVQCEVGVAGEALLPLARLGIFVSQLGPQEIVIDVDDKFKATLKSGSKRASLAGLDPKTFTEFKDEDRQSFTMSQPHLSAALRQTLVAVSEDVTRHVLNGVFFELKGGRLTIASTSGTQLSRIEEERQEEHDIAAILPTKSAQELLRLLPNEGEDLVSFGVNTARFHIGSTIMTSKLIADRYPPFRRVIPNESTHRVIIDREEFLSSMRLVNSTEVDPNKFPKVLVRFEENRMRLESAWTTSDAGDSIAIRYSGPELSIPLAPEQVISMLTVLDQDEVAMEFTDNLSPFVIKAGNFLGLTMPFRQT